MNEFESNHIYIDDSSYNPGIVSIYTRLNVIKLSLRLLLLALKWK